MGYLALKTVAHALPTHLSARSLVHVVAEMRPNPQGLLTDAVFQVKADPSDVTGSARARTYYSSPQPPKTC